MRYGFTSDGFAVVDDERRVSAFAYATSDNWDWARANPAGAAAKMLADVWTACPAAIRERHYETVCRALASV